MRESYLAMHLVQVPHPPSIPTLLPLSLFCRQCHQWLTFVDLSRVRSAKGLLIIQGVLFPPTATSTNQDPRETQ